jgi:sporulation protein YlmC with PRC-barrel domain
MYYNAIIGYLMVLIICAIWLTKVRVFKILGDKEEVPYAGIAAVGAILIIMVSLSEYLKS